MWGGLGPRASGFGPRASEVLDLFHVDVDVDVVLDLVADAVVCLYVQAHDSDYVSVYDHVQVYVKQR